MLVQRIETELRTHAALSSDQTSREGEWRILSIDMGIRNLAFAHLVTRSPLERTSLESGGTRDCLSTPELNAWRRLDVSNMETLDLSSCSGSSSSKTTISTVDSVSEAESEAGIRGMSSDTDAFAPHLYAAKAYTLISTLLSTYKPTHILIERQRFRSGGGSAVQEWTLRVGVFEGMLYAILHALSAERGGIAVRVNGVEPKRVVGYWEMNQGSSEETEKKKLSAREVKKVKIDTVGRWLDSAVSGNEGESRSLSADMNGSSVGLGTGVYVGEDRIVRELVDAYLRKWKGERSSKRKIAGEETQEVGKLDDLADCLLQGITWLEWQVMRERLIHEGIEALDNV